MSALNRAQQIGDNIEERIARGENRLWFGNNFLDDGLKGIAAQDLILVGAYSGSGKTELVTSVALHNVDAGKKVTFFALEAEHLEIENRILYRLMTKHYFADQGRPRVELDYADWLHGELESCFPYDLLAQQEFRERYKDLHTYYKTQNFDVKEFALQFTEAAVNGSDLIIVDHAHYFDWGDRSDNQGLKEVVMTARDLNLIHKVPVILVAHLRKQDFKMSFYAPRQEDFHGSSELYKVATKAITLGPGEYKPELGVAETYINAAKVRFKGESTRVTARAYYNFKINKYESGYDIGKSNQTRNQEFETLTGNAIPKWCKGVKGRGHNDHNFKRQSSLPINKRGRTTLPGKPYAD